MMLMVINYFRVLILIEAVPFLKENFANIMSILKNKILMVNLLKDNMVNLLKDNMVNLLKDNMANLLKDNMANNLTLLQAKPLPQDNMVNLILT